MTEAVVGLGGNVGDAPGQLRRALAELARMPGIEVVAVAGLWRSGHVGGPDQPDFHNTVAILEADVSPQDLLDRAHWVEEMAGRVRAVRWGPRSLDVDLITFGDLTSRDPRLTLPHPRAHERAFVLRPWAELQPDHELTAAGVTRTVAQWAAERTDQEIALVMAGSWWK